MGCAGGHLLECLVSWGRERGLALTPHGLDHGPGLIELARRRLPEFAENLHVGSAWRRRRRYRYVYLLYDCVPIAYLDACLRRLLADVVAGGRPIVGAYGSRSQGKRPFDIGAFMRDMGLEVTGTAWGGNPPLTLFAWVDA